jgi:hypothetical protein
VEQRAA